MHGADVERWLVWCRRRGLRPATIRDYQHRAKLLEQHAADLGKHVLELTAEDIGRWLDSRALAAWSRRAYGTTARTFFDWAEDEGLIDKSPSKRIVLPRTPPAFPHPIGDHDLALALTKATGHLWVALLLGALAGLRSGEIATIRVQDIDGTARVLSIEGKGGRTRRLPVHTILAREIARHVGGRRRGPVLDGWSSAGPTTSGYVTARVSRHFRQLGIDATCHALRHWFATRVYAGTRDIRAVQELLGHASPTTTVGYSGYDVEFGRAAVEGLALPTR